MYHITVSDIDSHMAAGTGASKADDVARLKFGFGNLSSNLTLRNRACGSQINSKLLVYIVCKS